jgi:hypothetical protein
MKAIGADTYSKSVTMTELFYYFHGGNAPANRYRQ